MSLTSEMRRIAKEDINDIVSMLNEDGFKTSVVSMESDPEEIKEKVKQSVHAVLKIDGRNTDVDFDYEINYLLKLSIFRNLVKILYLI